MTGKVFDEFDLATMRAAAQGFSPNDWDADPGDPEHGPAPDVVSGLGSTIMAGVERVMFWVYRNDDEVFDDDVDWRQPGDPPYWVLNDQWTDHLFEMRLYRELSAAQRLRWAS